MKPAAFDLLRPRGLAEALEALAEHKGDAKIIAGGQSLVPLLNLRMTMPAILIDVARLEETASIRDAGEALAIGATVRQCTLLRDPMVARFAPLLAAAVPNIGHVQTRARGTIGGSLVHADPAAEIPTVIAALDGLLVIRSLRGERIIPASDFFLSALTSALDEDELLYEIRIPKATASARTAFREIARRHGDFAIASAAVQATHAADGIAVAAALGGVAETPHRCRPIRFSASPSRDEAESVAAEELSALSPSHDIHASGSYRARLARGLLADCILEACG